jgi:hypothetical protein
LLKLKDKIDISATDKIVIISPCHYSNTKFINIVNDRLFNSSATIIHHQTDTDYLDNFKLLNATILNQKDTKVYFVDDSLISGKNFFKIYDLYRFTTDYNKTKNLCGAIFLSNKSPQDIYTRVSRAAQNCVYSFVNINLPLSPKIYDKKPLEHEVKRYNDLSKKVLHDVLKSFFEDKSNDVSGEIDSNDDSGDKSIRHYNMFRVTHKAFEYFNAKHDLGNLSFDDFMCRCGFKDNNIEMKMAMMKVLSQYPFLLYMPIRNKTFEWHKEWLNRKIYEIKNRLDANINKYEIISYIEFREIKFLIRRAVFLQNYNIISPLFLYLVNSLFQIIAAPSGIYKEVDCYEKDLFSKTSNKKIKLDQNEQKNIYGFHFFILVQYVELIHKNPWCALKIYENINQNIDTCQGQQFLRMLKIEMAILLNDLYSLLDHDLQWVELYKNSSNKKCTKNEIVFDESNKEIRNYLNDHQNLIATNKFEICNKLLGLTKKTGEYNDQFLNYLWIKQFLKNDRSALAPSIALSEKTTSIFYKLKHLFDCSNNIGGFFVVTDGKNMANLVYDKDSEGNRYLQEIDIEKHEIVIRFLNGESDELNIDNKTIIELSNTGDNKWIDIYSLELNVQEKKFLNDHKWALMMRISDRKFNTMGLIGFYSKEDKQDDLFAKQLLMLLREDLALFIEKHHKNDEFSALREAEATKRFAYLAGHGRQMLQKLAKHDYNTFGDIIATLEKLQYLFATKLISPTGNSKELKNDSNKNLFVKVFPQNIVQKKDTEKILDIATAIFNTSIIDNKVEFDLHPNCLVENVSFAFNTSILTFICFELVVNAKKNRFHFIDMPSCDSCKTLINTLSIGFEVSGEDFFIKIIGTGPSIPINVLGRINAGDDIKNNYEIAGINLINSVIKIMDARNTISATSKEICGACGICENEFKVQLKSF